MATTLPPVHENVRNLERKLSSLLETDGVRRLGEIGKVLEEIRKTCASIILQDIQLASSAKFEDRLWSAHQRVNAAFRESLGKLKAEGSSKLVEHRKLGSEYLKYIKSSQKFYRGLIRDLALANGGISELERVAKKLDREYRVASSETSTVNHAVDHLVLVSCHRDLIQLGDLSRYRETELGSNPKNWASAIGFYDLAGTLLPKSGIHHNQLAVVATSDGQHFRAAYHIYRAISAEEPHPGAEQNLKKMLAKVTSQWESGELLRNATSVDPKDGALIAWYLRLHFMLFKGKDFTERLSLEQEIQTQIEMSIKQNKVNSLLNRLVLINIAAEEFAKARFLQKSDSADCRQSYLFFLRQNILTMTLIMRVFLQELSTLTTSEDDKLMLTPIMERLLPSLNIYSLWLLHNIAVVEKPVEYTLAGIHLEFWTLFARCLTLVVGLFPTDQLPEVDWLLEEEAETVGFKPLQGTETEGVWERNGKLKPYRHEVNHVKDDFNREMLHRIRVFHSAGLELARNDTSPLDYEDGNGIFRCTLSPKVDPLPDASHSNKLTAPTKLDYQTVTQETSLPPPNAQWSSVAGLRTLREDNLDADAERMVNSIVGSEEAPDFPSSEPTAANFQGAHSVTDLVNSFQGYSRTHRSSVSPVAVAPFMGRGGSGSQPHSQEQSPALQHQHARLSTSYTPQNMNRTSSRGGVASSIEMPVLGPRSPTSPNPSSRPGTANDMSQHANLSPSNTGFRHHRVQSTDSIRSQSSIWAPDSTRGWPSAIPDTMPPNQQVFQGNNALGITGPGQTGSKPASPNTAGIDSPMLFGAGKSMWSTLPDDSKPFSLTGSRVSATTLRGSAPAWNASPGRAP